MPLGCLEPGESKLTVIRNGRKIVEVVDNFITSWERAPDAVSLATFSFPVSCCETKIHAWSDYVQHTRNGIVEWAGYVTRPEFDGEEMTIEAADLLKIFSKRIIRQPFEHVDVDISQIFTDYAAACGVYDPLPIILIPSDTGITATRTVTTAEYRLGWDAMEELLSVGLDVVSVGLNVYVGPIDQQIRPIRLTERMFKGEVQPLIGEDGEPYANQIVVKGANGLVSQYPNTVTPARPNISYPLVEAVFDAPDIEDQNSLDRFALEQYEARSQVPTIISMQGGVTLVADFPYELRELIPGRLVNAILRTECGLLQQAMRLNKVHYNSSSDETIKIEIEPAGLIDAEELIA